MRIGNKLMQVTSMMYLLSYIVDFCLCVEQPLPSCLYLLEPMAAVLKYTASKRTVTWLGAFGGDTQTTPLFTRFLDASRKS